MGVCQGAHIEIGGNHLGVGSLLSPCVLRRLELRLRPAGASAVSYLPVLVSKALTPTVSFLSAPPLMVPSAGDKM